MKVYKTRISKLSGSDYKKLIKRLSAHTRRLERKQKDDRMFGRLILINLKYLLNYFGFVFGKIRTLEIKSEG